MTGDKLYAWQVQESDGRWSLIGSFIPLLGTHSPLIHRDEKIVRDDFGLLARKHAVATNQPLRFVVFEVVAQEDYPLGGGE